MSSAGGSINVVIQEFNAGAYLSMVSLTLLLWDIAITMDEEVSLVWRGKKKFTIVNALFLVNRWFMAFSAIIHVASITMFEPPDHGCIVLFRFGLITSFIATLTIQASFCLRVWALYARSRPMGIFITLLFLSTVIAYFATVLPFLFTWSPVPSPLPTILTGCNLVPPAGSNTSESYFYVAVIVETILFLATIARIQRKFQGVIKSQLVQHVVASGAIYFSIAIFTLIFAILGTQINALLVPFMSNVSLAILSVCCSRLLLSIRKEFNYIPESHDGSGAYSGVRHKVELIEMKGLPPKGTARLDSALTLHPKLYWAEP